MNNTALVFLCFALLFVSCKKEVVVFSNPIPFNKTQKLIADETISIFENGTTQIQYGYIEYLNDGRGYTAGRAGFTSATCDLLSVVERYEKKVPGNALSAYIPRLKALCANEDGSVSGLEGFTQKWHSLANDPMLRAAQDEEVDSTYYLPAYHRCLQLGLKLPISLLFLYDAIIQHGEGTDPDGLPAMIDSTSKAVGGTPNSGIDEKDWIKKFMEIRKNILLNPHDPATKDVWAESATRVDGLMEIYYLKNYYLSPPVFLNVDGDSYRLPK